MCETPFPFEEARAAGLLLRKATGGDEPAYIELSSDTRVRLHLGGPVPVERVRAPEDTGNVPDHRRPGFFRHNRWRY